MREVLIYLALFTVASFQEEKDGLMIEKSGSSEIRVSLKGEIIILDFLDKDDNSESSIYTLTEEVKTVLDSTISEAKENFSLEEVEIIYRFSNPTKISELEELKLKLLVQYFKSKVVGLKIKVSPINVSGIDEMKDSEILVVFKGRN